MLMVIKIDRVQFEELIEPPIDADIPVLELNHYDFNLGGQSCIVLHDWEKFLGDEDIESFDLFFKMDVISLDSFLD